MTDDHNDQGHERVVLYLPATTLREKLGRGVTLAQVVSPAAIEQAERSVVAMKPALAERIGADIGLLVGAAAGLAPGMQAAAALGSVIEAAFTIKSRAGLCGYPLASSLARSLHLICEVIADETLTAREIEVVVCLVNAIKTVFELQITDTGHHVSAAITAEVDQLLERWRSATTPLRENDA